MSDLPNPAVSLDDKIEPAPKEGDDFLRMLVNMVNASDVQFPVTVCSGGILVTGWLAGGKNFFDAFASDFVTGLGPGLDQDVAKNIRENFASHGKIYLNADGSYNQDLPPATYIHIKNAHTFVPGSVQPTPSQQGVWWRGRLSAIDGFWLGIIQAS